MRLALGLFILALLGLPVLAEQVVDEVQLRAVDGVEVRPLDAVVIEVGVFGKEESGGRSARGRLQMAADVRLEGDGSGWLSRPFACDEEGRQLGAFVSAASGTLSSILGIVGNFTIKDCVLYTAPERPGRYEIEASAGGVREKLTIEVTPKAPLRVSAELVSFQQRQSRIDDPYRELAEHYAPFVAQETWFQPKADYITRFDYDRDWLGSNNWENLALGTSQAYVYYTAMETQTHWFLIYNFFHPRDYSDRCIAGSCHENDNEGMILTVRKDGSALGSLQTMETLAHDNIYSFTADPRVRSGIHDIDGGIELVDGSHPVVFVEAGGHGVYGSQAASARYRVSEGAFQEGTGVTYRYKGIAERPRHPNHRDVGYDLLPILTEWWPRGYQEAKESSGMFDAFYEYAPYGNRPRAARRMLGGAFSGKQEAENKAKPFWGWHDQRTRKMKVLSTGQWGLDPAYAVSRNLTFPAEDRFSLDYVYNPFLGYGEPPEVLVVENDEFGTRVGSHPVSQTPAVEAAPASETAAAIGSPLSDWSAGLVQTDLPGDLLTKPHDVAAYTFSDQGQMEFRGRIDGELRFHVRGDLVSAERLSGRPAVVESIQFTQALPQAKTKRFELQKLSGRGKVKLLETPSEANEYTAIFVVDDSRGEDDFYHLRLVWER